MPHTHTHAAAQHTHICYVGPGLQPRVVVWHLLGCTGLSFKRARVLCRFRCWSGMLFSALKSSSSFIHNYISIRIIRRVQDHPDPLPLDLAGAENTHAGENILPHHPLVLPYPKTTSLALVGLNTMKNGIHPNHTGNADANLNLMFLRVGDASHVLLLPLLTVKVRYYSSLYLCPLPMFLL